MSEDEIHLDQHGEDHTTIPNEKDKNALIYGFYTVITAHKEYCSSMQNRYRALTSTWVLGGFFAVGKLLSEHEHIFLPFGSLFGALILCFCTIFGVTLLWFLDVVLHQRMWLGTVVELARLEDSCEWLPKCNLNTLIMRRSKKFRSTQSTFYIAINLIFISISVLLLIPYIENIYYISMVCLGGLSLMWLVSKIMLKKSGELEVITIHSFR